MLAEDSPSNQAIINSVLKNMDIQVDIANNGQEAIELSNEKKYDLILMDMAMPITDGITATRNIVSGNGPNTTTPIIALTANAYAEDKKRCLESGMVDFLQKPIDINLFRSKMVEWCQQDTQQSTISYCTYNPEKSILDEHPSDLISEPQLTNAFTDTSTAIADESNASEKSASEQIFIDMSVISQLEKDTSREVLPKIIDIFMDETRDRLPAMHEFHQAEDWEALRREAHTLKSSAGSFGAQKLSVLARKIEDSIDNDDHTEMNGYVSELTALIHATMNALNDLKIHHYKTL